ncbi:TetR/AcrR family transcriptional regulator [Labrenzia sp. CE80]|uniref:TetR/AcrR family transcriptional regulator n=1 Tax=Labrenzia sp. CE80 TaxID=1788986 RepID=UPI00129B6F1F|nr:TetR/AcrR family transcriptional regulator [Labrenzia sp. CE80]
MATLELSLQNGLDQITTEEIAAFAGISTRTFFNYYKNKEAAAIGVPPAFRKEDTDALREGTAPLAHDLKLLLDKHIEILSGDEAILKMVGSVLRSNEKARGILEGFLTIERRNLEECLFVRVKCHQTAVALASLATNAIGQAIFLWEHEEGLSLGAALDTIWAGLINASQLLANSAA